MRRISPAPFTPQDTGFENDLKGAYKISVPGMGKCQQVILNIIRTNIDDSTLVEVRQSSHE